MSEHKRHMVAYVITKRGDRSFWNRVGVAFHNRDGSINVKLDAIPCNGEIQLREYVPREDTEPHAPGDGYAGGADFKAPTDEEIPF